MEQVKDPPKRSADDLFGNGSTTKPVATTEPPSSGGRSADELFATEAPGKSEALPPQQPPVMEGGGGAAPTFSAISLGLLEPLSAQAAPTPKQYRLAPETADISQATTPERPFTPAQVATAAPGKKEAQAERVLFNEKFAGLTLPDIKKYREERIAKVDAMERVTQQALQKDVIDLEQQRVLVEQARQAYERDPSPEAAANFDQVASRYNSGVSMLGKQQKAAEDARTVADRENRLIDLQEYSLKAQQGSTAGALWNNMLNSLSSAVTGFNSPVIDFYISQNPVKRFGDETQQQADDRLRNRVRGEIRGSLVELGGDPATTNEYIDEFSKGSFYKEALMGATGSLPLIATGPVGMITQAMDGVDKEMEAPEFDGVPQWKKRLFSATVGSAVGTLERLGFRNVARNSPMVGRILLQAIDEIPPGASATEIQSILDRKVKEGAEGAILRVMSGGLAEAETGGSQALVEPLLKEGFNASENLRNADISPTEARIRDLFAAMDGKGLFETPDGLSGYVTTTAKGAALEAVGGFMYATPYAASTAFRKNKLGETTTPKQFEMVEELAKDPNFPAFFEEQSAKDVEAGHITPEQVEQVKQDFATVTKLMDRIPDDLPVKSRQEAFDVLTQLFALSKKDPNLVANKAEALKQRLRELEGVPITPEATVDAEGKKGKEPPPIQPTGGETVQVDVLAPNVSGTPLEGIVGSRGTYTLPNGTEVEGDVYLDGQTVVIETPDRIYEVGNVEELASSDEKFPLKVVEPTITVDENGSFIYAGKDADIAPGEIVPQGAGLKAIKRDKAGNIKRIVVTDADGNTKNIKGQEAEDMAYHMMLRAVENNQSTLTKNDSIKEEIDAEHARQTQVAPTPKADAPTEKGAGKRDGGGSTKPTAKTAVEDVSADAASGRTTEVLEPSDVGPPVGSKGQGEVATGGNAGVQTPSKVSPKAPPSVPLPTPERVAEVYVKPDLSRDVSDNPVALATAYFDDHREWNSEQNENYRIFNALKGAVPEDSYYSFGDRNNLTNAIAKTYFAKGDERHMAGPKGGLDTIASGLSEALGREVTPGELTDFMDRFQNGLPATSPRMKEVAKRYAGVTGKGMNMLTAKRILGKAKDKDGNRLPAKNTQWTPSEQAIVDEAKRQGLDLEEILDEDIVEAQNMDDDDLLSWTPKYATTATDEKQKRDEKAKQTQPAGADGTGSEVRGGQSDGSPDGEGKPRDQEREILEEVLAGARKELEVYERHFKKQAQSLFDKGAVPTKKRAAEPGLFEGEGDTRANSAEDMEAGAKTLRDRVALAEKALADYDGKTVPAKKKAAEQQTAIPEAPVVAPTTPASFKRPDPKPVTKPTVLQEFPATSTTPQTVVYAIQGFEEYPVVAFKDKGGWKAVLRIGDLDMEIASGQPTHGIAATVAHEKMARAGKEKLDGIVESLMNKDEGPSEQRPFRAEDADAIGFNYTTDEIARERFDIPSLEKVGSGSDRDVYDLGNGRVLKVAKTARGLEQNMYEGEHIDFLPDTHEKGMNYVVVDKVAPAKASDVVTYEAYETGEEGTTTIGEMLKELSKFSQKDADNHTSAFQDAVNKYGLNDVMNYNILWNDFVAKRNWGVKDGMAIHLDGGTFGGVRMIDDFRGKKNLDDADFREIYNRSRAAKKRFGDKDRATMYQRPSGRTPKTGKPNTDKAMKALSAVAPGFKVIAPDNKADYQKAIDNYPDAVKSSWGLYDQKTNTAYINPDGPDVRNTLFHESGHPLLMALRQTFPEKFAAFHDQLRTERGGAYRRFATENYKDKSESVQQEEALAQFLADVADGTVPVSMKPDSLWQRFKAFIQDLLASLGWDMRSIDLSQPDNVRDFAAQFKKAMDKGIKITGLEMDGKQDGDVPLMQRPKTTKAKEWNAAVDDAVKNAFSKEQAQAIQDAANLIADPDGKAEFIKVMNEAWGVTKPPAGTKANQKKVSKVFLRDELIKAVEVGKRAGIADVAKARKAFVEQVKDLLSKGHIKGNLSDAQARSITARAAAVNPLNPKAVERFAEYAQRIADDVNLAAKEAEIKKLNKRIKTAVKGKADERRDAMINDLAGRFARINININNVDIDEHLEKAKRLFDTLSSPKATSKPEVVTAKDTEANIGNAELEAYVKQQEAVERAAADRDAIEEYEALRESMGIEEADLTADELKVIIDAMTGVKEQVEAAERLMQMREKVKMLRTVARIKLQELEGYRKFRDRDPDNALSAEQTKMLDDLMAIDADRLSGDEAAFLITAANNIIVNDRWGGVRDFAAKGRAERGINEATKALAPLKRIGRPGDEQKDFPIFNNTDTNEMLAEKIARGPTAAAKFMQAIGMHDWLASISSAKRELDTVLRRRNDAAKGLGFRQHLDDSVLNRYKMGFYAYLIQHKGGSESDMQAQFDQRAENVRESMRRMENPNKFDQFGRNEKLYIQAANDVLGDAKSIDDLNIDPKLKGMVLHQIAEYQLGKESTFNSAEYDHNKIPDAYSNYTRQRSMAVTDEAKADKQKDLFEAPMWGNRLIDSRPSSSKMDRSDMLLPGHVINADFFSVQDESFFETIADNLGAQHLATLREVLNDPRTMEMLGASTRNLLRDRVRSIKGLEQTKTDLLTGVTGSWYHTIAKRSMGIALKGVLQMPKQATVAISTYVGLGKDANLMWQSYADAAKAFTDQEGSWQYQLVKDEQIHERAKTLGGLEKLGDAIAKKAVIRGDEGDVERVRKVLFHEWGVAVDKLLVPLSASDAISAQAAWFAFYKKKLKQKGVDLRSEAWKHQKDPEAAAYANQMTSRQQNANAVESMAQIYREKGSGRIIVDMLFSYSSFALNAKKRMARDIQTLRTGAKEDKAYAARDLAGLTIETMAFSAMTYWISVLGKGLADKIVDAAFGGDGDDDDLSTEEWLTDVLSKGAFELLFGGLPEVASNSIKSGINPAAEGVAELFGTKVRKGGKDLFYVPYGWGAGSGRYGAVIDELTHSVKGWGNIDRPEGATLGMLSLFSILGLSDQTFTRPVERELYKRLNKKKAQGRPGPKGHR